MLTNTEMLRQSDVQSKAVAGNTSKETLKWVDWASRVILVPPIGILTMIGLRFIMNPVHATGAEGVTLATAQAITHMRVFGVFPIGYALALAFCLLSKRRLGLGLAIMAFVMGGTLLVRAYGVLMDGTAVVGLERRIFVSEAVFFLLSSTGLILRAVKSKEVR